MAFQTVKPQSSNLGNAIFTQQGDSYILQYDSSTGEVQIIEEGAPPGTSPIYEDGTWSSGATDIELTSSQQIIYHEQVKDLVYSAYQTSGGAAKNLILPQFAQPTNNSGPGQTSSNPTSNPSSNAQGSGSGLNPLSFLGQIFNVGSSVGNLASNGDKFGVGNEKRLFGGEPLMYPVDMNIEQQDTLQITAFVYRPSKAGTLFGGKDGAKDILQGGFQQITQKSTKIGMVILPMPKRVTDSNNTGWDIDNMDNITAAVTANTMTPGGIKGQVLGALGGAALGNAQAGLLAANIIGLVGAGGMNENVATALGPALAEKILKAGGFGVEAESILARGAGIVPNSNTELLFKGPTLRAFNFAYRLTPRSEPEARKIRRIIRFFKQLMAAKKQSGKAGQASFFLGTPSIFQLEYRTNSSKSGGGQFIEGVNRFKVCALKQFDCDFTPDGFWAAYKEGQPISTTMTMGFAELDPIYDTDYQSDTFGDSGLEGINDESIGY